MEPWGCLAVWLGAMLAIALPTIVAALKKVRASRGRWGDRLRVHEPESDGPYREGSTTERTPRRAPLSVWAFGIVAPGWASITILFVAPMCGLLGLTAGFCTEWMDSPPCEAPAMLHLALLPGGLALAVSALVLGLLLIRDAISLPTAGIAELRACRITARCLAVHHAGVLVCWATGCAAHDEFGALPIIVFPCVIGVLVALVEWRASSHVARALASEGGP